MFASVDDLVRLWRPLSAQEQVRAEALLESASAILRAEIPHIDQVEAELVCWVAAQMVKRVMASANDLPITNQQRSIGGVSAGFTLANPSGDLYLTRGERRMLGGSQQKATTVSMIPQKEKG